MNLPKWLSSAGVLCVLVGGVALLGVLVLTAGEDFNPLILFGRMLESREQEQFLNAQGVLLKQRMDRKREVSMAVVEGRMSLLDAAALFRDLDQTGPNIGWEHYRASFPGGTDEERHCREVIVWVERMVDPPPPERAAVVERLERELEELLRHGPLSLPERGTEPVPAL
jgi:hypothetical protein